ncbi:unnamed protein product [marine sediment metagenome]|uniref:Alpha 1,4-glycosyltransferase domain-containing protein n=1 Tax=marine sediment metagenome TaxID=412755 RepID=X0ZYH0_9ZZZZ
MNPYDQSDFVRYYVLRDYGGVWLDTDFIVYDNLDKLIDQMKMKIQDGRFERPVTTDQPIDGNYDIGETMPSSSFLTIREHIGGCKASAILASKKGSDIAHANCKNIEHIMSETTQLTKWGEIGPGILKLIPKEIISQLRVINDMTAVASVNFSNWLLCPGHNFHVWFKNTPEEARIAASNIDSYQLAIAGTWTIYRDHDPEVLDDEIIHMIFDDDRSIFKALIDLVSK